MARDLAMPGSVEWWWRIAGLGGFGIIRRSDGRAVAAVSLYDDPWR
jgi:hypothetical protein